jgi:hypothetical protein
MWLETGDQQSSWRRAGASGDQRRAVSSKARPSRSGGRSTTGQAVVARSERDRAMRRWIPSSRSIPISTVKKMKTQVLHSLNEKGKGGSCQNHHRQRESSIELLCAELT